MSVSVFFCQALIGRVICWESDPEGDMTAYKICDASSHALTSLRERFQETYKEHTFTRRGLASMFQIMPPFIDLRAILKAGCSQENFRLLEQGCGSGHFLLYAKGLCPSMAIYGANLKGYNFGQADGTPAMMLAIAEYFKVPLMCNPLTGDPALPDVRLTKSLASSEFNYLKIFKRKRFDLIVSRDALGEGMLLPHESHIFIPKMLVALKPGGTIIAQTAYGADYVYHDVPGFEKKSFTILGVFNARYRQDTVSILLYKIHQQLPLMYDSSDWQQNREKSFPASFFGLVIRRCLPNDTSSTLSDKGCIVPPDYTNPYPEDLKLWNATFSKWQPHNDPEFTIVYTSDGRDPNAVNVSRVDYIFEYYDNLRRVLQQWTVEGIPDLSLFYAAQRKKHRSRFSD